MPRRHRTDPTVSEAPNRVLDVIAILVKVLVLTRVRNTRLQDLHADLVSLTRIRDYSYVTVIDADGQHISWSEVSHFREVTVATLAPIAAAIRD